MTLVWFLVNSLLHHLVPLYSWLSTCSITHWSTLNEGDNTHTSQNIYCSDAEMFFIIIITIIIIIKKLIKVVHSHITQYIEVSKFSCDVKWCKIMPVSNHIFFTKCFFTYLYCYCQYFCTGSLFLLFWLYYVVCSKPSITLWLLTLGSLFTGISREIWGESPQLIETFPPALCI